MTSNEIVVQKTTVRKQPTVSVSSKGARSAPQRTTTVVTNVSKAKKRKQRKSSGGGSSRSMDNSEVQYFKDFTLYPDLYGPTRFPRAGASTRTGLGFDETTINLNYNASYEVQGFQLLSVFNNGSVPQCGNYYQLATASTPFGSGTANTAGIQFPDKANMADCNITSACIVVWYQGPPTNVKGDIIFGNCLPLSTLGSYATQQYYPGTVQLPLAAIIQNPVRVSMRKQSPVSDEFVATNAGNADLDLPFVFYRGMATDGQLMIKVYRCFEYRSSTGASSIIPYQRLGPNHANDAAARQNAQGDLAELPAAVTPGVPSQGLPSTWLDNVFAGGFATSAAALIAFGGQALARNRQRALAGVQPLRSNYMSHGLAEMSMV